MARNIKITTEISRIIVDMRDRGLSPQHIYLYPVAFEEWVHQIDQAVLFQKAELELLPMIFELQGLKDSRIFPHLLIITEEPIDFERGS